MGCDFVNGGAGLVIPVIEHRHTTIDSHVNQISGGVPGGGLFGHRLWRQQYGIDDMNHTVAAVDIGFHNFGAVQEQT